MVDKRFHAHIVATIVLSLVAIVAVVGGCTISSPSVTSTVPANNSTNVPVSPAVIQYTFDQSMNKTSVEDAFSITPSIAGAPPVYSWTGDKVFTVTFQQGFTPDTKYTAQLGTGAKAATDVALGKPYVLTFTTGASTTGAGPSGETAETTTESTTAEETTAPTLTFTHDIQPLAVDRCSGCHGTAMSDYDNIIAKKYVVPGKPADSTYYLKPAGLSEHPGGNAPG